MHARACAGVCGLRVYREVLPCNAHASTYVCVSACIYLCGRGCGVTCGEIGGYLGAFAILCTLALWAQVCDRQGLWYFRFRAYAEPRIKRGCGTNTWMSLISALDPPMDVLRVGGYMLHSQPPSVRVFDRLVRGCVAPLRCRQCWRRCGPRMLHLTACIAVRAGGGFGPCTQSGRIASDVRCQLDMPRAPTISVARCRPLGQHWSPPMSRMSGPN